MHAVQPSWCQSTFVKGVWGLEGAGWPSLHAYGSSCYTLVTHLSELKNDVGNAYGNGLRQHNMEAQKVCPFNSPCSTAAP